MIGSVASAPSLVPRRPLRSSGVGIPENNLQTGPGAYTLPLPMLSGTPAFRPSTFSKEPRVMSHVKAPATHATYEPPLPPRFLPGGQGFTFSQSGQLEVIPDKPTPRRAPRRRPPVKV